MSRRVRPRIPVDRRDAPARRRVGKEHDCVAMLYLLGTGAAVSDPHRTTTMLAVSDGRSTVLVDCGGDAFQRLLAVAVDPATLDSIVITHEHPDHVAGFPLLVEKLWVFGRRRPVDLYGIAPAIGQARRTLEAFDFSSWEDFPEVRMHEVPPDMNAPVLISDRWRILCSPAVHGVPVSAHRIEDRIGGGSVCYSGDTEYCANVVELARGVDILVHEATGEFTGHSSPIQAARVAVEAGARRVLLVHLPAVSRLGGGWLTSAHAIHPGLELGEEGGRYYF